MPLNDHDKLTIDTIEDQAAHWLAKSTREGQMLKSMEHLIPLIKTIFENNDPLELDHYLEKYQNFNYFVSLLTMNIKD